MDFIITLEKWIYFISFTFLKRLIFYLSSSSPSEGPFPKKYIKSVVCSGAVLGVGIFSVPKSSEFD